MSAASHIADGPLGRLSVSGHVWSTRIPRALLVQHADWTDSRGPLTAEISYDGFSQNEVAQTKGLAGSTLYQLTPSGTPTAVTSLSSGVTQYLVADGQGNVSEVTNSSQAVLCAVRYDAYGSAIAPQSVGNVCNNSGGSTVDTRFYRGDRIESASGDYTLGSRVYNPATAQFLTPDSANSSQPAADLSIGTDPLTLNRYDYVNGDPVNLIDPTGHNACADDGKNDCLAGRPSAQQVDDVSAAVGGGLNETVHGLVANMNDQYSNVPTLRSLAKLNSLFTDPARELGAMQKAYDDIQRQRLLDEAYDRYLFWTQYSLAAEAANQAALKAKTCDNFLCGVTQGAYGALTGIAGLVNPAAAQGIQALNQWIGAGDNPWLAGNCTGWCVGGQVALDVASVAAGGEGIVGDAAGLLERGSALIGRAAEGEGSGLGDLVGAACHSFAPGTLVVLADGSTKAIDKVAVGDRVRTTDPATGADVVRTVTQLHHNDDTDMADVVVRDATGKDATVHTTQHHRFWDDSRGRWVDAGALLTGDRLHTDDGAAITVVAVRSWTASQWMFDLTVDDVHTFYIVAGSEPVLVHNCGGLDVLNETLHGADNGVGNITSAYQLAEGDVPDVAEAFLGPNYQEAVGQLATGTKSSVYYADQPGGQRFVFRMDDGSLMGTHSPGIPHVHFEIWDAGRMLVNNHVGIVP